MVTKLPENCIQTANRIREECRTQMLISERPDVDLYGARTKGYGLTRGKSTYKKRGPKRKPRPKKRYYVKTGGKGGRPRDPNSRRSLAKKRRAANKPLVHKS